MFPDEVSSDLPNNAMIFEIICKGVDVLLIECVLQVYVNNLGWVEVHQVRSNEVLIEGVDNFCNFKIRIDGFIHFLGWKKGGPNKASGAQPTGM